jgi:hypothetical protein
VLYNHCPNTCLRFYTQFRLHDKVANLTSLLVGDVVLDFFPNEIVIVGARTSERNSSSPIRHSSEDRANDITVPGKTVRPGAKSNYDLAKEFRWGFLKNQLTPPTSNLVAKVVMGSLPDWSQSDGGRGYGETTDCKKNMASRTYLSI